MTAEAVVADTDVASHLMRGTLPAALAGELRHRTLLVTFVTVGELFRGAAHASWGTRRVAALADWVSRVSVLRGSEHVARRWGQLTGEALRSGRPLPANDAWVAACCLAEALPLATLNLRHYEQIAGLELVAAGDA